MTPQFTTTEQALIDEQIRRRSETFDRPPWMQSHRATTIKLHVRRLLAEMPPEPTGGDRVHYHAGRRVVALLNGRRGMLHEADADGLPICAMRSTFEQHGATSYEGLGGGPVTCGHCANTRA